MLYGWRKELFSCLACTKKQKKNCFTVRKKALTKFDCVCEKDKDCEVCKGKGSFKWYYCPKAVLKEPDYKRLFYYYDYHLFSEFRVFPDGKGIYYQPVKLLQAFNFISDLYFKFKEVEKKEKNKPADKDIDL